MPHQLCPKHETHKTKILTKELFSSTLVLLLPDTLVLSFLLFTTVVPLPDTHTHTHTHTVSIHFYFTHHLQQLLKYMEMPMQLLTLHLLSSTMHEHIAAYKRINYCRYSKTASKLCKERRMKEKHSCTIADTPSVLTLSI